ILLTVVEGLYRDDPKSNPGAKPLPIVTSIDTEVMHWAGTSRSPLGTAGMGSKLRAARIATGAGETVIIANGLQSGILDAIFAGEPVGTLFLPHGSTMPAWKRWLGYTAQPQGQLIVDDGARVAVQQKGRSLLPIGLIGVSGSFRKGDVVALCGREG